MEEHTSEPSGKDHYQEFWENFRLFPYPWGRALVEHPAWLLLIFTITYGMYLASLLIESRTDWTEGDKLRWWGKVFIGQAEAHILFIAALFVAWFLLVWARGIPDLFGWLRYPAPRLFSKNGHFEMDFLSDLEGYQRKLNSRTVSVISLLLTLWQILKG